MNCLLSNLNVLQILEYKKEACLDNTDTLNEEFSNFKMNEESFNTVVLEH